MMERTLAHHGKVQWLMCPVCRQRSDYGNMAYVDDKQNKSCQYVMPAALQCHGVSEASLQVKGSYGTKIEAITRRILWIKCIDPEAKVIIFSSWNDVLDVLEYSLKVNEIIYIRAKGGRKSHAAIAQFKGQKNVAERSQPRWGMQDPEMKHIQVLLLLISHGANGLNILEARHVILVEPLLNPATEAQAVNRVHRIGQEKATFVHHFIVKDTVEEGIYKLNRSGAARSVINESIKSKDRLILTVKEVESLLAAVAKPKDEDRVGRSPAAAAAAQAAERRSRIFSV